MSKRLYLGMVLIMLLCWVFPLNANAAGSLTDIGNHWAKQQILRLYQDGYVTGFPDNTFRPDEPMTRAGFVTVLVNCLGGTKAEDQQTSSFSDVKGHWSQAAVNRAVKLGVVVTSEYPNGFAPDNPIKRSEAAAMIVRALGLQPDNGNLTFKDAAEINKSLYKGYIKKAVDTGLISGYPDGYFYPFNSLTRCQSCVLMIKVLDKRTGTTVPSTPSIPATSGQTIIIGTERYDLANNLVYLTSGSRTQLISQFQINQNTFTVNMINEYPLNSILTGFELTVNNNRFPVSSFRAENGQLIASVTGRKLVSMTVDGYKYNADMINLYITGESGTVYLGDALILDAYNLQIGNKTYNLQSREIYVTLSGKNYRLRQFIIGNTETILQMDTTASSFIRYPSYSAIADIYVNNRTVNYDYRTARLFFIINDEKYELSNISIDPSGNINAGGTSYLPSQVSMFYNDVYYKVNEVRLVNDSSFSIYCTYSDISNLIRLNNKYRSASGIQILKDGTPYNLDEVFVVSRNVIRIGGRQYNLDSTIKARYDGQLFDITEINFDNQINGVVMTTTQATYISSSLPYSYKFYEGSSLLQSTTSGAYLYAGSRQLTFQELTGIDPIRFTWNGTTYNLIGAEVRLNGINYIVTDTIWRGSTQYFEIYLRRL